MTKPLLSLDSGALGFQFVSADAAHAWAIGPAAAALRVKSHGGTGVKLLGDALMAAVGMQDALQIRNSKSSAHR